MISKVPLGRIAPVWWVPIGLALVVADYLTGHVTTPPAFAVPVTIAAWYSGAKAGVPLAIVIPVTRLLTTAEIGVEVTPVRFIVGVSILILLAVIAGRLGEHERELRERIAVLESLLPMCAWCKSIRGPDAKWESLEAYIQSSGREVTHGICPECVKKHYPEDRKGPVSPA